MAELDGDRGVASGTQEPARGYGPAGTFSGPAGYLVGLRAGPASPLATPMDGEWTYPDTDRDKLCYEV